MNKDRIAGSAKEIKARSRDHRQGNSDAKLEADGKADKVEGKIQNAVGGLKEALKK